MPIFRFSLAAFLLCPLSLLAAPSPYRGLWVGEVLLDAVNEVTVPLDANNIPVAPNPAVPTKTSDTASLRLILHVDSLGQASLLKEVAVLSRTGDKLTSENDMALITNPKLYGEFPPQPAMRVASATFDFGDSQTTAAVQQIMETAATAATTSVRAGNTEAAAATAAQTAAAPLVAKANVAERFSRFLQDSANKTQVTSIATGTPAGAAAAMTAAGQTLRDGNFYQDTRGVEMAAAISAAVGLESTPATKLKAALNTAASFADTADNYERFLVGKTFGDMIRAAAQAAGTAVALPANALKTITAITGTQGAAPAKITTVGHGLATGEEISIAEASVAGLRGNWTVTRVDADNFLIQAAAVTGRAITDFQANSNVSPVSITATAHGLASGAKVTISGSTGYDGVFTITVVDADHFTLPVAFSGNPPAKGQWSAKNGNIGNFEGTTSGAAGVKITAPGHGLAHGAQIEIFGSAKASYNGVKTISRIDNDSFSIAQAFDGNPAVKGQWAARQGVVDYAAPAAVSTFIVSAGHGLAVGDKITVTGSGLAAYNGPQTVESVTSTGFSIAIPFVAATGNPAAKGTWAPVAGGSWRRLAPIRAAVAGNATVTATLAEAARLQVTTYQDTRAADAAQAVLNAVSISAAGSIFASAAPTTDAAETAGRAALGTTVKHYAQPSSRPSPDYDAFAVSTALQSSVTIAANAAAAGAFLEKSTNSLASQQNIYDKALQQAANALESVLGTAAMAVKTELPMSGSFAPGSSNLAVTIQLPANHPTNPFRHRRHPDHAVGFDITRKLNLSFDGKSTDALAPSGYGVQHITGTYNEEIMGLHKKLGPNQDTGLKVKGTFTLHRISLIDTLNGK